MFAQQISIWRVLMKASVWLAFASFFRMIAWLASFGDNVIGAHSILFIILISILFFASGNKGIDQAVGWEIQEKPIFFKTLVVWTFVCLICLLIVGFLHRKEEAAQSLGSLAFLAYLILKLEWVAVATEELYLRGAVWQKIEAIAGSKAAFWWTFLLSYFFYYLVSPIIIFLFSFALHSLSGPLFGLHGVLIMLSIREAFYHFVIDLWALPLALTLSWLRMKCGSARAPIILHAYNVFLVAFAERVLKSLT